MTTFFAFVALTLMAVMFGWLVFLLIDWWTDR